MSREWSRVEVEATVASYLDMLAAELKGEAYNKTEHRRALQKLLDDRSEGAIERKHQNISAVLIELGFPYIDGYKPLGNYQRLLSGVLEDRLSGEEELKANVGTAVQREAEDAKVPSLLAIMEDPPEPRQSPKVSDPLVGFTARKPRFTNYLAMEARNSSLGLAGERLVLRFEKTRLEILGEHKLAARVEHVAATVGDGTGFDIRSFEKNGAERLIEVKTTAYGKQTPFFLSKNELEVSRVESERYHLYRLFKFRKDPRCFSVRGALDRTCVLNPTQYRGVVA